MKKLFLFLLFIPFFGIAQNDTSYATYVKLGDLNYTLNNTSLKALKFYVSAIKLEKLENCNAEVLPTQLRISERAGTIAYDLEFYEISQSLYQAALQLSRRAQDIAATTRLIPKVALTYEAMRNNGLNTAMPIADAFETAEVYFRIIDEPEIAADGKIYATINAGYADGLFKEASGVVYATFNSDFKGRENTKLGTAEVLNLDTNTCKLAIGDVATQTGATKVLKGDMVMMLCRIPQRAYRSVFWDLALMQIVFRNLNEDPIYDYRQLLAYDSQELEAEILEIMRQDVYNTWQLVISLEDKTSLRAVFEDTIKSGRFLGLTVVDVMERTNAADIRSFLGFVKVFPGKYMGTPWKINETYATWLLNNSPIGFDEFFGYVMAAKTKADYQDLVLKYRKEIEEDDFLTRINMAGEAKADDDALNEAIDINNRAQKLAVLLDDGNYLGWAYFSRARIFDKSDYADSVKYYYEKALPIFESVGDKSGIASTQNNLGSWYYEQQLYEQSLDFYQKAYQTKLLMNSETKSVIEYVSLAKSQLGIGQSFYFLGDYDVALSAYKLAISFSDSAQSLEGKNFSVSMLTEEAKLYKKRGQFDLAVEIYTEQLVRYKALGQQNKVADALDNLGDVQFELGEYQNAFNNFYQAYTLKIAQNDWSDAGFSMSNCGQAMWNLSNLDSAIACHTLALALREKGNNPNGKAFSLAKIATLYKNLGNTDLAESNYQAALNIYRETGDSLKIASVATDIGRFYYEQKNYSAATEFYDYALKVYQKRNLKSELAELYGKLGDIALNLKNYNQANFQYQQALKLRREMNERQNMMYSLVDLSIVMLYGELKLDTVQILLAEALQLANETGSKDYQAYCYQSIGNVYSYAAKTDSAEQNYNRALALYAENGDISGQCKMLRYLGSNSIQRGEFATAKARYEEAISLARSKNLRIEVAETYNYFSEYYYYTGEFANSFAVLDSCYKIFGQDNNKYGIANTHLSEGNTHNLIGNASRATEQYRISDSIYNSLEDPLSRATAINNMGTIAFQQGDYDQALELFYNCKEILDSVGLKLSLLVTVTGNLGEVYMERGIWSEAEKFYAQSTALAEEMGATRQVWGNKTMMAKLLAKQGKNHEAIALATKCYDAFVISDEKMAVAECATILGKAYRETNNPEMARKYLTIGLDTYRNIGSKKLIWEPLYQLALVEKNENNTLASINYLKEAVDTLEILSNDIVGNGSQKKLFAKANNKKDIYQSLITQLVLAGKVGDAYVYQEKLNIYGLNEQTRGENKNIRGASDVGTDEILLSNLELKKDGIYNQLLQEKAKPASERSTDKILELERLMTIASEDFQNFYIDLVEKGQVESNSGNSVSPDKLDQYRYDLEDDMVVLQYLVTDDKLIIFIAANDTLGAKIIDISKENIENYVAGYYNLLINKSEIDAINNAAEQLYGVLIAPVKSMLSNKTKIAFVPSGILFKLPFHSLGQKENGKFNYIASQYNVFYINDMSQTMVTDALVMEGATLMAFGNADKSLPFAENEVNNIGGMFANSSIYLQDAAQENIAKTTMKNYKIVHFATHGNLDPVNFNNSYLTLAPNTEAGEDGMFTMSEIYRTSLRGCQLVVLSACNTAVNNDKLDGFINNPAKAFLTKGAKSAIASLWAVDDAATGELMNQFYTNLKAGKNKVVALHDAQLFLMRSEKFSHPYYWAAFELIGQWE